MVRISHPYLRGIASILAGIVCLAAARAVDTGLDVYLKPQILASLPDGRKVHFFCLGEGAPTAILESGWGTAAYSLRRIQGEFAKTTRVCVFERAGYGFSDPGPMPRDSAAGVADLHAGLRATGILPPYVLVGHSLGGFDARLFAYTYPREVTGLLLMDPPTEDLYRKTREPDEDIDGLRKCIVIAKARTLVPGPADGCVSDPYSPSGPPWSAAMKARVVADQSRLSWFETLLSEDLSMVNQSADELAKARHPLGDIPLIVLQADMDCHTTGSPPVRDGEKLDAARCAALERQAQDSTRGQHRVVAGSRHYIYQDKPMVALAAFREVVEGARNPAPVAHR